MAIILDGDIGVTAADVAATTLSINAGYGSNAAAYGCRAWVNFNGTGTVAIRESGNVSSITDNGTGNYTVNFSTAMPDANYCANITYASNTGSNLQLRSITRGTTSAQRFFVTANNSATGADSQENNVSIFR